MGGAKQATRRPNTPWSASPIEPAKREEPLGGYDQFVDSIGVNSAQRWQRELAGRRLLRRHPDITASMVCGQQRRAPASWAAERREEHRPRPLRSESGEE